MLPINYVIQETNGIQISKIALSMGHFAPLGIGDKNKWKMC